MQEFLFLLGLGIAVGATGSLVGAGGGFILVPLLLLVYPGDVVVEITSVSLVVVFFTAFSGSITYAWMRRIDYRAGLAFALAGSPTAMLGAYLSHLLPRFVFDPVMAFLMIGVAIYLIFNPKRRPATADSSTISLPGGEYRKGGLRLGCILTSYIGILSGLAGLGGGIVQVSLLVRVLRFSPHVATATSLFVLAILAFAGMLVHVAQGRFIRQGGRPLYLAMGVMMGAQLGAKMSSHLKGTVLLRILTVILAFVGLQLLWTSLAG